MGKLVQKKMREFTFLSGDILKDKSCVLEVVRSIEVDSPIPEKKFVAGSPCMRDYWEI